ncbi:hypothetical protein ABZ721_15640 [Streptomyces sp. NPDC006733]|uniref:hypothetical protein n=1 Tax=Streptomyces sp. NPDC006733 TaxID=3155460 RepID=UPI0033ECFD1B
MERAPNLRMIALTSVIALAVVLPLAAATAGPAGPAGPARGVRGDRPQAVPGAVDGPAAGTVGGLLPGLGPVSGGVSGVGTAQESPRGSGAGAGAAKAALRPAAACGPQLTSPEGLQAQTCTITVGGDTWGRSYYRNGTGEPLGGVLTLMRPDGRTVRVECPVGAGADPASCETPRERTVKAVSRDDGVTQVYSAVAEFASAGSERMLLRVGSNR